MPPEDNDSQDTPSQTASAAEARMRDDARKADRRILRRFRLALAVNVVVVVFLVGSSIVGLALLRLLSPARIPWLVSSDGLSFVAFVGATLAYVVRHVYSSISVLASDHDYFTAADRKADIGASRRRKHERWLEHTGPILILVLSGLAEATSLVLKWKLTEVTNG